MDEQRAERVLASQLGLDAQAGVDLLLRAEVVLDGEAAHQTGGSH